MSERKIQRRHAGARWQIRYGSREGTGAFALAELQRAVQPWLPYVIGVRPEASGDAGDPVEESLILLGTPADHPRIRELSERKLVSIPGHPQGYAIARIESPWSPGKPLLALAGRTPAGALHAVEDFAATRLSDIASHGSPERQRASFDGMAPFSASESPAVERRGIWTWGYVIYDYRRFYDHMARLRMNSITIWNDVPPENIREIVAHGRSRGIETILGFHWGWGVKDLDLSNPAHLARIRDEVLAEYRRHYKGLDLGGIYFQTETEHGDTAKAGGRSTAAIACDWVNGIAKALLAEEPKLKIGFGLHATSIRDRYGDLKGLDPRVSIVWEDAGMLPYTYDPVADATETWQMVHGPRTYEETIAYSKRIAALRPGCPFDLVPKGWTCLDWKDGFEHHGPFVLGESDPARVRERFESRRRRWDYVNSRWARLFPLAARFYREILDVNPSVGAWGLLEDGLFEEEIQPSVALFAETLWNPRQGDAEIHARALDFARRSLR